MTPKDGEELSSAVPSDPDTATSNIPIKVEAKNSKENVEGMYIITLLYQF